uniref:Immunoglobulin domain-containing protein n=1 Tax=Neogobius melanostomus TaxID=47308 RepID=A0A8C6UYL4_9GOBI
MTLSPDQSQFFRGNSVSFSCGASGPWTVRRNSSGRYNQLCSDFGDVHHKSSCSLDRLFLQDSGQYWCETNRGLVGYRGVGWLLGVFSDRGILLQIPVRPVSVGDSVFLLCQRDSGPALPARFYRDGLLLPEQPAGHTMSLQQVAMSDSGLYQCESGGQRSESSRLRVHSGQSHRPGISSSTLTHPAALHIYTGFGLCRKYNGL